MLKSFRYYLVVENKRDIALLGYDFIDKCRRSAEPSSDIFVSEFDDKAYGEIDGALESNEVITLIDSQTD